MSTFNIEHHIKSNLRRAQDGAAAGLEKYKQGLLATLKANLAKPEKHKNGALKTPQEKIEDNSGLITRYKTVKPRGFNQMQQAFADALV